MKNVIFFSFIVFLFISCKKIYNIQKADSSSIHVNNKSVNLMGDKKNAQPEKNKNDIDIIETKNSNNNQFFFKSIDISKMIDNRYKRIYEIYGNLFLLCKEKKVEYNYKSYNDGKWIDYPYITNILESIEYYYKNSTDYILLGKVTTTGIFDKNDICIYQWNNNLPAEKTHIGFISEMCDYPFLLKCVLTKDNELFAYNPKIVLSIDINSNSISVIKDNSSKVEK